MTNSDTESIAVLGNHRKAYELSLPEILGLPKDEIQTVNTDVMMSVGRVRAACGRISGLRGETDGDIVARTRKLLAAQLA